MAGDPERPAERGKFFSLQGWAYRGAGVYSWKQRAWPFGVERPLELFSMALLVVTCIKLLTVLTGPRERFLVDVAMVVLATAFAASLLNPVASLARHALLVLWFLAFLTSLSMFS